MSETLTARRERLSGKVRVLKRSEMPLLRDHLLRLDAASRRNRFNGVVNEQFLIKYAAGCDDEGVIVIGYIENGEVRAAAELHEPQRSSDKTPEIAFSVEPHLRRQGVGSVLFKALIAEARRNGYTRLRVTTGVQNDAMRSLARKFGVKLNFHHGELAGSIDLAGARLARMEVPALKVSRDLTRAMIGFNQAFWNPLLRMWGVVPYPGEPVRSSSTGDEGHRDPRLPDHDRKAEQHQDDERNRRAAEQTKVLLEGAHRHDQVEPGRRRQIADFQIQDHD
jgi:GNAT superfamily N-acetyltransferase